MNKSVTLEVLSHGVKVTGLTKDYRSRLSTFMKGLELEGEEPIFNPRTRTTEIKVVIKKKFFTRNVSGNTVYIHRHMLQDLKHALTAAGIEFKETFRKIKKGDAAAIKLNAGKTPRDYQQDIIDYVIDGIKSSTMHSANIILNPGAGKTYTALNIVELQHKRLLVMIQPKYFGLWHEAFDDILDGKFSVMEVSGSKSLKDINKMIVDKEPLPDIILMSSITYRTYIENWERFSEEPNWLLDTGYLIEPDRWHERAGIGVQINDEIQDDPGLVFKIDTVTNVPIQLYLSATPYTGNDKLTDMINVMMPECNNAPLPDNDVYTNVIALLYNDDVRPGDYLGYKRAYSQIKYEANLIKHKQRLARYLGMISKVVSVRYYKHREPGQRMLIFFATVAFIEIVAKHLQRTFPDLKINPYVAGVPYESLLTSDISVTTLKSGGTGVDVRNVKEIFSGHATDSKRDSIQMLGRARRLKDFPDISPCLTYSVCMQIPQHIRYMRSKEQYFSGRVLTHKKLRF